MYTDEQRAVIEHDAGHAKVSAVAGAGKTATMIGRVARLIELGAEPRRIRVLMFNKSAQLDFAARLREELPRGPLPTVQTFHSLAWRLCALLTEWGALPAMRLETSEGVLGMLAGQALRASAASANDDLEDFLAFVSFVKSGFASPDEVERRQFGDVFEFHVAEAFRKFEEERKRRGIRFHDDVVIDVANVLRQQPGWAERLSNKLDHLIVDEYQDVNEAQQFLMRLLAGHRAQVMVVGDVDQCIYEWRGARPEYITSRFDEDFPGASSYTLTRTFRFGHSLSLLANHSIRFNRLRDEKLCVSSESCGPTRVRAHATDSPHRLIGQTVKAALASGRQRSDIAVLARLYTMALPAEVGLLLADIPYRLAGGRSALERDELRAMLGYLELAAGRFPGADVRRNHELTLLMLKTPVLGLRREDVEALARDVAREPLQGAEILREAAVPELARIVQRKLLDRAAAWESLLDLNADTKAVDVIRLLKDDLDLYEGFRFSSHRAETAREKELLVETMEELAEEGDYTVAGFLDFVADLRSRVRANREAEDAVLITSVHKAKGLEWPVVIVPNLIEGQFPFYVEKDGLAKDREESERRIYYVAVTRARDELHLVHPLCRELGKHSREHRAAPPLVAIHGRPSRFLFESNFLASQRVGEQVHTGRVAPLKVMGVDVFRRYGDALCVDMPLQDASAAAPSSPPVGGADAGELLYNESGVLRHGARGAIVHHPEYGAGRVLEIRPGAGIHGETRLVVKFAGREPRDYGPESGLMRTASS